MSQPPPQELSGHEAYVLRVATIVPSVLSIVAVPSAFIWWWFFHKPGKLKFRHMLIWALLVANFFQAIVMIIYPAVNLHSAPIFRGVTVSPFCNGMGFFTELTVEIADFAVLILAIHTALSVFSTRYSAGQGLYRFRYGAFLFFIFVALIFSIVAVIPISHTVRSGYTAFNTWCYLRLSPSWYRLALSWVPRIVIMATILIIYIAIFVFVKIQTTAVDKSFSSLTSSGGRSEDSRRSSVFRSRKRPKIRLKRPENWKEHIKKFFSQFPGLGYLYPYKLIVEDADQDLSVGTVTTALDNRQVTEYLQNALSSENYLRFQRRRADIEKQVSFLFIYPIVYVLIWTFPLIQQYYPSTQRLDRRLTLFWINILASWFRPFSGFINSLVFVLKESQYSSSIEGQQQQTEFPMGFVDQNQPSSQARLRIDTTSDFVYEPNHHLRLKRLEMSRESQIVGKAR